MIDPTFFAQPMNAVGVVILVFALLMAFHHLRRAVL